MASEVKQANFETEVLKADKPVLVDFWAEWCGPCKMLAPTLDEISQEYGDKIKVLKVDVDQNNELASQYGIMSIPALLIFKDGKVMDKKMGALPKADIEKFIAAYI